jgi:PAS domain S-box-containing protein
LKTKLKILHLEAIPADAELVERELKKGDIRFEKLNVDNKIAFKTALREFAPDIIISDYTLPSIGASEAIRIMRQEAVKIPFILVTAAISDEYAVKVMKAGADDYIFKDRLRRLPQALLNAMEKNKTEQKLYESETFNKGVLSSLSSHIAVINADGTLVAVNKAWDDFAKANGPVHLSDTSVGSNYFVVCKNSIASGDDDARQTLAGILSVFNKETPFFQLEYPCHSPEQQRWFILNVSPFGEDDTKVVIAHQNITERKTAENCLRDNTVELKKTLSKLNKILDSSLDVICSINVDGEFVTVSTASRTVWGYSPEELIGSKFMHLVHREDVDVTIKAAEKIFMGSPIPLFENRYVHKSGKVVSLLWSVNWDEKLQLMFCIAKDVTERKRLEKSIENERDRFSEMFLRAPASMAILRGPDHTFQMANKLYLNLTGRKNIIGKTVREVFPEVESQGLFDVLDHVYKTSETYVGNGVMIKLKKPRSKGLVEVCLNFVFQAYHNGENEIEGIFAFIIDITEQQKAKENLLATSERLLLATKSAKMGIWEWDYINNTTTWDNRMYELYGMGKQHFTGAEAVWQKGIHPDDSERVDRALHNAITSQIGFDTEFRVVWPDKSVHYMEAHAVLSRNEAGAGGRMIGVNRDITERKKAGDKVIRSETKLKVAQRIAQVGSWEVDLSTNEHSWSDEFYRILGIREDIRPSGKTFLSFVHPDDRAMAASTLEESLSRHTDSSFPFRFIRKNGEMGYASSEWKFELDSHGNPLYIYGILRDLTKEKKAESERLKMTADLIQRNHDLEQFTFIMSHNLRAPAANIIACTEVLLDETITPPEQKEFLEGLSTSVAALDTVIRDINSILQVKSEVNEKKEVIVLSRLVDDIMKSISNGYVQ